jgi:hypothetical protein
MSPRRRPRRWLELETPAYNNPGYVQLKKSEGARLGLLETEEDDWEDGMLLACAVEVTEPPSRTLTVENTGPIILISMADCLEIRMCTDSISGGTAIKSTTYLKPRKGISFICQCAVPEQSLTTYEITNSCCMPEGDGLLMQTTGRRSHCIIPYPEGMTEAPTEMAALIFNKMIGRATITGDDTLQVFWVEPPTCEGHPSNVYPRFKCRWCESERPCSC